MSQFFGERGMPFPTPPAPQRPPSPQMVVPKPPAPTKPLPTAPAGPKKLRAGMMIVHPVYGEGLVVRREGEGEDAKITVSFPRHGMKKLIEKYAKLKRS
jgi:DNA helicase-2/ATP-dependent DNA helicase PcrA